MSFEQLVEGNRVLAFTKNLIMNRENEASNIQGWLQLSLDAKHRTVQTICSSRLGRCVTDGWDLFLPVTKEDMTTMINNDQWEYYQKKYPGSYKGACKEKP